MDYTNAPVNKANVFDWDRDLKVRKLDSMPRELPVSVSERERILPFITCIDQIRTDNTDVAMIALEKVSVRWPHFIEASSLYGLLLAKTQRFAEAEKQFEKVLLALPDADISPAVNERRKDARQERIREVARDSSRRRREHKLLPVRASLASSGILQRAADEDGTGRVQMASKREQEEVLRSGGDYAQGSSSARTGTTKLFQVAIIAVIVASILFLIFYFVIRPSIVANENRRERLEWLEAALSERAGENESIGEILDAYRKAFGELDVNAAEPVE